MQRRRFFDSGRARMNCDTLPSSGRNHLSQFLKLKSLTSKTQTIEPVSIKLPQP